MVVSEGEVETLLKSKGIAFSVSGKDFLIKCLNPEHEDNNPSLRVDKLFGVCHCFACGFSADIFEYFGLKKNYINLEALKLQEKLRRIESSMFGLDMPKGFEPFRQEFRGIGAATYERFEAFTHRDYEDRIVFPIKGSNGKIIAFIGRHIYSDVKPRYLIDPAKVELPTFPEKLEHKGTLVIVEGIFDFLNLYDKGLKNCCAILGVDSLGSAKKGLNKDKIRNFKLQGVTKILVMFDGDDAGRKATKTLIPLLEEAKFVTDSIDLEDDTDPGDLSRNDVEKLMRMI